MQKDSAKTAVAVVIPDILEVTTKRENFPLDQYEIKVLATARGLFDAKFYPQCLLEVWNAAIHNLRRRIEVYGIDLFLSVVKDEGGRKSYNEKGESFSQRWANVDAEIVIQGARKLGLLKGKAAKVLETINWMRNHASPSHETEEEVEMQEVLPLVALLQSSLFSQALPTPGHSVAGLFKPVKENSLSAKELEIFADQIRSYRLEDIRTCFGFLLDLLCNGVDPAATNAKILLPVAWEKTNDDLKKMAGFRYHTYSTDPAADVNAKTRLLEFLIEVEGIAFIPEGVRATLYRDLAKRLANAKNTSYGWAKEESVAETIAQFGANVPSITFEEFYQEVLAVCCGNYWGRSDAYEYLEEFVLGLSTEQLREILRMFRENRRVQDELTLMSPKGFAIDLIRKIQGKFTFAANKKEAESTIDHVAKL